MSPKTAEWKVGLVILAAVALLIYGIIWIRGARFGRQTYPVAVIFPNVGSLSAGDPVSVSGVLKGKVKKIELYQGDVRVHFTLEKDVVLKKDARFTVMNIGLMGERFVAVETGKSDTLLSLTPYPRGYYDTGIPEVMGMMGRMMDEVRKLVEALRGSIGSPGYLEKLASIAEQAEDMSKRINRLLAKNEGKVNTAFDDLSRAASQLKNSIAKNADAFDSTLGNLHTASQKVAPLVDGLDSLRLSFRRITNQIEKQEGTLGKLVFDRTLYDQMRKTTRDLDSLILDVKRNPRRYLTIKVF
ncbi:MAG: MlaD family protein [candidate division Zixibacteria bacterium]|nr:MlaD family protein [candidate division Zixibacteria bacterium]